MYFTYIKVFITELTIKDASRLIHKYKSAIFHSQFVCIVFCQNEMIVIFDISWVKGSIFGHHAGG